MSSFLGGGRLLHGRELFNVLELFLLLALYAQLLLDLVLKVFVDLGDGLVEALGGLVELVGGDSFRSDADVLAVDRLDLVNLGRPFRLHLLVAFLHLEEVALQEGVLLLVVMQHFQLVVLLGHAIRQFGLFVLQLFSQRLDLVLEVQGLFLEGEEHTVVLLQGVNLLLALGLHCRHVADLLLKGLVVLVVVLALDAQVLAFALG